MDVKTELDSLLECLLVISAHHGSATSRESLMAGLPLEQDQLTPSLFGRAAARAGLVSKVLAKPLSSIRSRSLPVVLLLKDNGACLLMGWNASRTEAQVIFPECPDVTEHLTPTQLAEEYSGVAIYARPRFTFDDRTPEVHHAESGHWFWSAMRENLPLYRDVMLAAFFINLFALALPLFTMNVYDRVVPNHAIETLWMLAAGIGVVLLADLTLRTMRAYFLDLAGKRVDLLLSVRIMERVLGLRMELRPLSVGAFAANLRSFETVRDFITSASLTALIDLPFTLIFLLVLGWIHEMLVIPLLVGILVVLIYAFSIQRKMRELTESTYRASAMRNSILIESLVGLETVKSIGAEGAMQKRWERSAEFLDEVGIRLRLLATGNLNVTMWVQQLVSVSIIVTGVYLITGAELSLGGLIAATMLANRAMAPLGQIAGLMAQFHNARTAFIALNEIMDRAVERPTNKRFFGRGTLKGDIEFKNVSFNYPGSEVAVLKSVSFKMRAGERVAVLGRVGSGKSTLHRLLMGLYQPSEGVVMVDGIDTRQLDPAELRGQVGYVPQEVTLFYGSLRDNLLLAHPLADERTVERATAIAGLRPFVDGHPQGFDMNVGERGESLSGGQRKAVGLARAVMRDPPILLLDEVTGSMDHSSEAEILASLQEYSVGKSVLMITHRTALLELVDRILVIDGGKIVADGPKDQVVDALRKGRIGRAA